jgi:tetratricopeptide (TPR) repeat protein
MRRNRGGNLVRLGQLQRELQHLPEAAEALRRARHLFENLQDEPGLGMYARWGMATCDNTLGMIAADRGDLAQARADFEAAHAARRQLVEQNPTVHNYRAEFVTTCLNLARHYRNHGEPRRAAEVSEEACPQAEELVGRNPMNYYFRSLAIRACRLAAGDAEARRDPTAAARLRARAAELLAGFGALDDRAAWLPLARDAITDGLRQLHWGHWRAAVESFRQAGEYLSWAGGTAQSPDQRVSASRQ